MISRIDATTLSGDYILLQDELNALRDEYIKHYIEHYDREGDSGAGLGLTRKPELLKRAGYEDSMTLLDYGCGWGAILGGIEPKDYLGVDIVPQAISLARDRFPGKKFEVLEIGKLKTTKKDMAIALSVFTHALHEDVADCLDDIVRNVKKNGIILVDILKGNPEDSNIHYRYTDRDWFVTQLENRGLKVVDEFIPDWHTGQFKPTYFVCHGNT